MKILIAGCSFCTALESILAQKIPGCSITNLSHSAAGNKFIADSVIAATIREKFDLIYVSWSELSRLDVVVDDSSCFYDWMAKGKIYNTDYIFTGGIGSWDHHKHRYADSIFVGLHKFLDQQQLHYLSLLEMLKIQKYLQALDTPHYFSIIINQFNEFLPDVVRRESSEVSALSFSDNLVLIKNLNLDNWILDNMQGEFESCYAKNLISDDKFHPTTEGYSYWMDLLVNRCKQDKII
jgi:hypothetical protein